MRFIGRFGLLMIATIACASNTACSGFSSSDTGGAPADAAFEAETIRDSGLVGEAGVPVDATPELDSGAPIKLKHAFVTSAQYDAVFGGVSGVSGADDICNALGSNKLAGTSWKAWLSTSKESAASRFSTSIGNRYLLDDTTVALTATSPGKFVAIAGVHMDEKAAAKTGYVVWTGTGIDGSAQATCNDWTTSASEVKGTAGRSDGLDANWTKSADAFCNGLGHLYCIEP